MLLVQNPRLILQVEKEELEAIRKNSKTPSGKTNHYVIENERICGEKPPIEVTLRFNGRSAPAMRKFNELLKKCTA